MSDGRLAEARRHLSRGDPLIAYDEATRVRDAHPDDLEAQWMVALTLARAGAHERAAREIAAVQDRIDTNAPIALQEDVDALVARLAKDEALAGHGDAGRAAALYEAAANRYGRHYSCVNAATLWLLAGDERRAHDLAVRAHGLATEGDYWSLATEAEAALVVGDVDGARDALQRAAKLEPVDHGARAVTRRQLRLICAARNIDTSVLAPIAAPAIANYSGRMMPADWAAVRARVVDAISKHGIGFAYGSLAWGADIVAAECLVEHDVELHVVLPFAVDEFAAVSVAPGGDEWLPRFHTCLDAATSLTFASDSAFANDSSLFEYGARIAMGHALNRAAFLDAEAVQLVVTDGTPETLTARDIAAWQRTGSAAEIINIESAPQPPRPPALPNVGREVRAIIFADFHGFSRLHDEDFPPFIDRGLGAMAHALAAHKDALLWCNTWGDAIQAVFVDVRTAAHAAIALHDAVAEMHLADTGLPADLELRVGAHAGPVLARPEPFEGKLAYWGRELTRAARIEPRTPEGEVYVTDAFAALLALEPAPGVRCEYVGRITTAKDFETIPMYRLRNAPVRG